MTIGQWQAKAKANEVVVGGLKIMRKLTFAPFLCLLAFSSPTNTRNTQYKARASRKHGRRQGWSHHFGLLLLLGLYLFMLFLGLTLHAWQNPGFLDTIHPPNPLLDYLKFMVFSVEGLLVVLGISSSLNWLFLYQAKTHTHIEVRYQTTIKVASIRRS